MTCQTRSNSPSSHPDTTLTNSPWICSVECCLWVSEETLSVSRVSGVVVDGLYRYGVTHSRVHNVTTTGGIHHRKENGIEGL